MCGIFFSLRDSNLDSAPFSELCESLQKVNGARGPDSQRNKRISTHGLVLDFFASELRLRGAIPIIQPHECEDSRILSWNGELALEIFDGIEIGQEENDGVVLFKELCAAGDTEDVCRLFGRVEGPYAFVYYDSRMKQLFFARDPLGRRSLLVHHPTAQNPYFMLASTSVGQDPRHDFQEVNTQYIYSLEVAKLAQGVEFVDGFQSCLRKFERSGQYSMPSPVCATMPPNELPLLESLDSPGQFEDILQDFIHILDKSVALRVQTIPVPPYASNVAGPFNVSNQFYRVPGTARLAILFSGGIDSTVLAFLAHRHLPDEPIDLLNVAFENPYKLRGSHSAATNPYLVPDRETGLSELAELKRLCPRQWNFVEVNVPYEESQAAQAEIESLMFPAKTVMDLSLAMALFFASRGHGIIRGVDEESIPYKSTARVLLNGLGADELLGGYSRHKTAFRSKGWEGLVEELQMDLDRIPTRNLGRDDRVISSFGKETRHPFLSLSVVDFVARLPVQLKMDPRAEAGVGDKALLRLAARLLGLEEASGRRKRAMQFGSRSARREGEKYGDALLDKPNYT
uniref:Asparagine synthetase domain-containing protein 1 n=1 Tax=Mycena chlorophos TaxID=658473 RepID=A0ABQ0LAA6_MYCCL|nr:asparagine synthetase domain-containing protein 1 [Mycena chlorophos]